MEAAKLERSKLVQRQKQQRQELEKKVKKLKGMMKEAAEKELGELDSKHEAELVEFDKEQGLGGKGGGEAAVAKEEAPALTAKDAQKFRDRNWSGLSKKELEEECVNRGLGKKGSKEDLIQKLIIFQQDVVAAARNAPPVDEEEDRKSDEEDDEDEEDDDEEEDEEDEDQDEVDAEEMERQGKREKAMQKAIKFLLADKCKEGFPLSEFMDKLESVNVKGFLPEKCGYKTLEKFVRGQPESVLRYKKKAQMILPAK
mmetsp:Transcript_1885/g.4499  ORF Transcript_1885/g.4499 Transcript_1885/m.4499 type:complete len:256 (-) Transcript_1885:38-805(-)